jgi:hypothetical protein
MSKAGLSMNSKCRCRKVFKRLAKSNIPKDLTLPFFAYGIFRPGELGFLRLIEHVAGEITMLRVKGHLKVRDGLPLLVLGTESEVEGYVIPLQADGYRLIADLEPHRLYYWAEQTVSAFDDQEQNARRVNVLVGRSPEKGADNLEDGWHGHNDPLFSEALPIIRAVVDGLHNPTNNTADWDCFFRAQMAYLLLWSAIERYASIRYHLGGDFNQKILEIHKERAFQQALRSEIKNSRRLYRADTPEKACKLLSIRDEDTSDEARIKAKNALLYYAQVRNNIVHRGKAGTLYNKDYEHVCCSLKELLKVFDQVLTAAFKESSAFAIDSKTVE